MTTSGEFTDSARRRPDGDGSGEGREADVGVPETGDDSDDEGAEYDRPRRNGGGV